MPGNNTNRLFETNNYSIVSKYSAIKKGYFSDPLLIDFIENHLNRTWRRTPIVNRGYAARLLAMDWIISRSIVSEALDCLIVLGAGFDTLPLRYSKCCWIEIDLPQVVETKLEFLNNNKLFDKSSLVEVDTGIYSSVSRNYHLISCDLQDSSKLTSCLNRVIHNVQNSSRKRNFAIVNEVCLCYLEMETVANILQVIISTVQEHALRVHYIGYEQLKPKQKSQFSDVMLNHFESLGHPLKYFPTASQIKQLFCARLNFNHITVIPMYQLYHNALLAYRREARGFQEEPFDEYEEMDLYLSHYALVTGVLIFSDPFIDWYDNPKIFNSPAEDELSSKLEECGLDQGSCRATLIPSEICRFGHATCILEDGLSMKSFIITGGFGASRSSGDKDKHMRLNDCSVVSMNGSKDLPKISDLSLEQLNSDRIRLDRMHGQVTQVSRNLLFFNGGRQCPDKTKIVNGPFIGEIDGNQLKMKHLFDFESVRSTLCWRHRLSRIVQDKMFQVGGLGFFSWQALKVWNLSSSKLGFTTSDVESLNRHSFGMDMRDDNTLLVFGGLNAQVRDGFGKDSPVEDQSTVVLWDFRSYTPTRFDLGLEGCYNADVHFISDNQFVRIGGVSCKTGAEAPLIETIDLRGTRQLAIPETMEVLLSKPGNFFMLTNSISNHFKSDKTVVTAGGGGNYFTFGTQFTRSHLVYAYGS